MRLPVALQAAFERSERQFQKVLSRLGLTREQLNRVVDNIQAKKINPPPVRPAASQKRRVIHV
jgi:hypothetical protein